MKTLSVLLVVGFFFTFNNYAQAQNDIPIKGLSKKTSTGQLSNKVVAKEIMVSMPTSRSGFSNPNTPFLETGGRDEDFCYPVPFNNHILRERPSLVNWRIVVLENEYLHVEFAPELGGMIWRLFDKINNADVLHAPGKVTPVADGFGGTYTPGGLELNYPYAHAVTNTWPRKTEFKHNKDGSATYIVSEWERNGRTQWSMEFTLKPGESKLRQDVTIYNRSKIPASFVYWGNARVPATADTRWIYPETMASEHGGSTMYTWPIFRDKDFSLMVNDPEVIGMYFLEPRYNFFGLTNLKTKSGMVHFAAYQDVPGKKLWNWGRTPKDGNRKWDASTETGHEPHMYGYEYGEVQSGRIINQDHLEWLMPDECITWQEAWSPIYGLSNVNEVTEDAAFQLLAPQRKLLIYPFTQASNVKLQFIVNDKPVKVLLLSLKTSQLQEINLEWIAEGNMHDLEIKIVKSGERSGNITLKNRTEQKKASELRDIPIFKEQSSESLSTTAEFEHKLLYRNKALKHYKTAIQVDSLNYRAHLGLGKLLFGLADFKGARQHFEKAIQAYKWAGEAYLMLAQIDHLYGNLSAAEDRSYEARYFGEKSLGNLKLGEVLITRGEYDKAKKVLEESIINNARSFRTYALLALCERKMGNPKLAQAQLDRSPAGAMKDLLWYTEAFFAGRLNTRQLETELFRDEWRFLEVSMDYLLLGALEDAEKFADAGITLHQGGWELEKLFNPERMWNFTRKRETPFFYLIKGVIAQLDGRKGDASKFFKTGDYFEHYVNFNQPEMVPIMEAAINAGNGFASFWLGNFYYHNLRYNDAKIAWEVAAVKHPGNPQILRNLAVYEEHQKKDLKKSQGLLRKALQINPNDVFIRQQLVSLERATGSRPEDILKIYMEAPKEQRDAYLYSRGFLQAFKSAGKWKEAAEYLKTTDRRWSDDVKSWYHFSIEYADYLVKQSKPGEALEWIASSSRIPVNLSNISLPVEYFYRHREYYISGLAYKMMGDTLKSNEFFRKVIDEQTDFMFKASMENRVTQLRFYVALAMKELGMETAGRGMLVGINEYRMKHGFIPLHLEKSEIDRWNIKNPLAEPVTAEH